MHCYYKHANARFISLQIILLHLKIHESRKDEIASRGGEKQKYIS